MTTISKMIRADLIKEVDRIRTQLLACNEGNQELMTKVDQLKNDVKGFKKESEMRFEKLIAKSLAYNNIAFP